MTNPPGLTVKHISQAGRFYVEKDGLLAVLKYQLADGNIIFTHGGNPAMLGGQGLGSRLAIAGSDDTLARSLAVVTLCSFIGGYIQKHTENQDLVK